MIKRISLVGQNMAFAVWGILFLSLVFLPSRVHALGPGEKAPNFHVVTLQSKDISYDRDIKGKKPLYLFFWTTW